MEHYNIFYMIWRYGIKALSCNEEWMGFSPAAPFKYFQRRHKWIPCWWLLHIRSGGLCYKPQWKGRDHFLCFFLTILNMRYKWFIIYIYCCYLHVLLSILRLWIHCCWLRFGFSSYINMLLNFKWTIGISLWFYENWGFLKEIRIGAMCNTTWFWNDEI